MFLLVVLTDSSAMYPLDHEVRYRFLRPLVKQRSEWRQPLQLVPKVIRVDRGRGSTPLLLASTLKPRLHHERPLGLIAEMPQMSNISQPELAILLKMTFLDRRLVTIVPTLK